MPFIKIKPPVIAHRGASAYAPENTIAAFLRAKQLGAQWVEFDVMLTADEEVVVIHDACIDRTTQETGLVSDKTSAFLQTLDAGSWFDPLFSDEKIPLFVDVIDCLKQQQLQANVEIKALAGKEQRTAEKVLEVIAAQWSAEMTPPLISSFSLAVLEAVRRLSATSQLGFLMHEWVPEWEQYCDQLACISVNLNENLLTAERVKKIQSTNRAVLGYTVNDVKRARELFSWGIDAVFTDCPDKILNDFYFKKGG